MMPRGAVASPHHLATEAGAGVLADGGTALDAAIATNAVLCVVYPHMCGLGGDLFLLYHEARTGRVHALNASGAAPARATIAELRGRGLDGVPVHGPLAATVPGAVRGWQAAVERFGTLPVARLLAPAIAAAEDGHAVSPGLARWIAASVDVLAADPTLARWFLPHAAPLGAGATLRQPELAATLRRLADAGLDDLHRGELADAIAAAVAAAGGVMTREDLAGQEVDWAAPVGTSYRGLKVVTTPPNSQGVTGLAMLHALEELLAPDVPPGTAEHVEALVRGKLIAFDWRDRLLGDPRFTPDATAQFLDRERLRAALRAPLPAAASARPVGDTVAFCAVDREGNACSAIQSIYYGFGSGFVAGDTGVLLHNRGHYFRFEEGHPNALAPGRRPLHTLMVSMALQDGRPRFVYGSMGADGQPQFNVQVLERLRSGLAPQDAVGAPRVLHGRFVLEDDPALLQAEEDLGDEVLAALESAGHRLHVTPRHDERFGHAHAIALGSDGSVEAGADPRSDGSALVV